MPKAGEAGEQLLSALRALHAEHADADGCVTLVYETEVYRSTAIPSGSAGERFGKPEAVQQAKGEDDRVTSHLLRCE